MTHDVACMWLIPCKWAGTFFAFSSPACGDIDTMMCHAYVLPFDHCYPIFCVAPALLPGLEDPRALQSLPQVLDEWVTKVKAKSGNCVARHHWRHAQALRCRQENILVAFQPVHHEYTKLGQEHIPRETGQANHLQRENRFVMTHCLAYPWACAGRGPFFILFLISGTVNIAVKSPADSAFISSLMMPVHGCV